MSVGGKIYKAIADAMTDISPIAKAKRNQQQGFLYRGIDDVMNELSPILAKHRIFIYPEVVKSERSERQTGKGGTLLYSILTVVYHFATDDGSEVCVTVIGEGMDSGDKATNKAMAVAMKYACLQMFCIPTEDMSDPDAESQPPSTPKDEPGKNGGDGMPQEIQALIDDIGRILRTENPDRLPFFARDELDANRDLVINAKKNRDANAIRMQHNALIKELARRQAEDRPVPHGDGEFRNDIPDGMYKDGEEPLF